MVAGAAGLAFEGLPAQGQRLLVPAVALVGGDQTRLHRGVVAVEPVGVLGRLQGLARVAGLLQALDEVEVIAHAIQVCTAQGQLAGPIATGLQVAEQAVQGVPGWAADAARLRLAGEPVCLHELAITRCGSGPHGGEGCGLVKKLVFVGLEQLGIALGKGGLLGASGLKGR